MLHGTSSGGGGRGSRGTGGGIRILMGGRRGELASAQQHRPNDDQGSKKGSSVAHSGEAWSLLPILPAVRTANQPGESQAHTLSLVDIGRERGDTGTHPPATTFLRELLKVELVKLLQLSEQVS